MKVSLNWVKEFTDVPADVDKLAEKIGAQLGAVEGVLSLGERYHGALVAKVVSAEKHPNADKLRVCLIDDAKAAKNVARDKNGLVQVVCGAPNVAAGQLVVWLPPGVVVPSTFGGDQFKLEAKELRGVVSNGMIASARELAIGDSHKGILVLDKKVRPGQSFAKAYGLDDYIIDIENKMFTHRPDCFGILGVAREIAGINGRQFKSPVWYKPEVPRLPAGSKLPLKIANSLPEAVPRFMAVVIEDVSVAESPVWLQAKLARMGAKPINNIVDITNYLMLMTAQPLHAYDYDKLKTSTLGVRLSKASEMLTIIGGKELALEAGHAVITDGTKPIGLGGVMGGADTQVDEQTRNIIIECATFDMNLTRKSAMAYGLFTDAATRFTKNQSPLQNPAVIGQAVRMVTELAGGKSGTVLDDKRLPKPAQPIHVPAQLINERLGLSLGAIEMKRLLDNVEFKVRRDAGKLAITPPFWRTDIEIPEDIVEEIGRLYGYDHLKLELPRRDIKAPPINELMAFKSQLREILVRAGANEVINYSFVHGSLLERSGQDPKKDAYHIRNALSPELQYYRTGLALSLLEKIRPNVKQGYDTFALFEIGKVHIKGSLDEEKLPKEHELLGAALTVEGVTGAPYYHAQYVADYLLRELNLPGWSFEPFPADRPAKAAAMVYEPKRSAVVRVNGQLIGMVGEPSAAVRQVLKLPAGTAMFELDVEMLKYYAQPPAYQPLNRFPSITQDICLRLPAATTYRAADDFVWQYIDKASKTGGYRYHILTVDIFQKPKDTSHKQITWRIIMSHPERTMTTEESNKILDGLAQAAKIKLKAERI